MARVSDDQVRFLLAYYRCARPWHLHEIRPEEVLNALRDERQANERLRDAVKDLRAMVRKLAHEQPGRAEANTLLASTADLEGA